MSYQQCMICKSNKAKVPHPYCLDCKKKIRDTCFECGLDRGIKSARGELCERHQNSHDEVKKRCMEDLEERNITQRGDPNCWFPPDK